MGINSDRKAITEKQLNLQVQLNTIHENIRENIRNRTDSGSSNQNRKMLLVFISLSGNHGVGYRYFIRPQ
jgi:hypothetical protein